MANLLIIIVALLHLGFMVLEMALWQKPAGHKIFRLSAEQAAATATLAANQGLYNGFLAAGLLWSVLYPDTESGIDIATFFLGCVIAAGVYGAWSVNRRIFFVQACPAILALLALYAI